MNIIQEQRIKNYFLTATKELIRAEGLQVVSTRNIAQRAGYSYATLYNHFKDIRDLIFSCVEDFMEECREFVVTNSEGISPGINALCAITLNYSKFFVQYPGIFDLFFQEKVNQISTNNSNLASIDHLFDSLTKTEWQNIQKLSKCSDAQIAQAQQYHKLALHGLLMFFLNRRKNVDFKEFSTLVNTITEHAININ